MKEEAATDAVSRNRLYWKCRRGLLELDIVLQRFIPILRDEDVRPLHDLLDLLLARKEPADELDRPDVHAVLAMLRTPQ